jgi:hypothetical protein
MSFMIGDRRRVVVEGAPLEDGTVDEWYVEVQRVAAVEEYEPGFPVKNVTWEQVGDYLGPFNSETEAQTVAADA